MFVLFRIFLCNLFQTMPRLRIGISRPPNRDEVKDYVLSGFNAAQKERLPHIKDACVATLMDHILKRTVKT